MWSGVVNEGDDIQWVLDAMVSGTAIWVTDGSYNKDTAPLVSGAGWLIYCRKTKDRLMGSFFECSPKAGSYRGELLGLLALHTLIAALVEYYQLPACVDKICCDNITALNKSKVRRTHISTGASQADILSSLRNIKSNLKHSLVYEWVAAHQDDVKKWDQLTLEQQLNCMCDALAKGAVSRASALASTRTNNPCLAKAQQSTSME